MPGELLQFLDQFADGQFSPQWLARCHYAISRPITSIHAATALTIQRSAVVKKYYYRSGERPYFEKSKHVNSEVYLCAHAKPKGDVECDTDYDRASEH